MADKPKEPAEPKPKKFEQIVRESPAYEPPSSTAPDVELVGRIRKSTESGKLILLVPAASPGIEHAVEINAADVTEHKAVFEDASGESTFSVRLPADAQMKLLLPGGPAPKRFDPKQFDPKQFDPKISDPKFDPKQFDPKTSDPKISDPKQFDPKVSDPKQFDPKTSDPKNSDPKQFDPKVSDPKQFDPKTSDPKISD